MAEQAAAGVTQYVILGAGLDTLAQRRPELGARLRIFEVDQPGTQAWKRRRLVELGFGVPDWLRLVPIDFETGRELVGRVVRRRLRARPARGRGVHRRQHVPHQGGHRGHAAPARRARPRLHARDDVPAAGRAHRRGRPTRARGQRPRRPRAPGTPFISFYSPEEMLALARDAGFRDARHVSSADRSPTATSRAGQTACVRPAARN